MRVAVVGAGVMGCAAARALAADGHDVQLYEQYEPGNERGSSHGRSRIVRLAYPQPQWVRLAERAMRGWRELEAECGQRLLHWHGLLELAADAESGSAAALAGAGARFEPLTAAQVRARWPVAVPAGWTVLHQPAAGIVRADLALRALLDGALRRGARLRLARVESVDAVDADAVVVTAGSWVRRLLPDLPVRVTRETVAYFRRGGDPPPAVVHIDADGRIMYSLYDPVHGLKAGAHHAGRDGDPEDGGGPDPELVDRIAAWVRATHPDTDPRPVTSQACMYTTTSDERFILRRGGRVIIGSACSGHGFKFAPVVGRLLADHVTTLAP